MNTHEQNIGPFLMPSASLSFLTVKDLEGRELTVTNLEAALAQANEYATYRYVDPTPEQARQEMYLSKYYWDLHGKLMRIRFWFPAMPQ